MKPNKNLSLLYVFVLCFGFDCAQNTIITVILV